MKRFSFAVARRHFTFGGAATLSSPAILRAQIADVYARIPVGAQAKLI